MVGVLDPDHLTDIHDLFICIQKQFFSPIDPHPVQVLYRSVLVIFCKFAAQAKLVDAVFKGELVERVGLLVRGGETPVHIGDVGWDVIGARLLDRAPQVELREEIDEIARAHHAVDLCVDIVPQYLFPCRQYIRIFVKSVDGISQFMYFLEVAFEDGGGHKADRVVPDIVLADQFVVSAAVYERQSPSCEVISRVDPIIVFKIHPSGTACGVHDAERVEICRLVGERRRDGHGFVAQFIGECVTEIVIPAVCVREIIGQGKAVACF